MVELARAMALHPAVHRVDLLTRLIRDPKVAPEYGVEEECLARGRGERGGAYIVRLPCGPTHKYIRKEALWPHVREFADRGIAHAAGMLGALAEAGRRCELYACHGHYGERGRTFPQPMHAASDEPACGCCVQRRCNPAWVSHAPLLARPLHAAADGGEVALLMCHGLDVPLAITGHSLGRNKLEHLLSSSSMTRAEAEETYAIGRRIEAEERCLDAAAMVFTSTQQEVDEQWGLYDGYNPQLARVLRFRRSYGRHMPLMTVSPPGLDFSSLKVSMPEDPTLLEFEQQRAALAELELAPLSPGAAAAAAGSPPTAAAGASSSAVASPTAAMAAEAGQPSQGTRLGNILPDRAPIWQDIARYLRNPLKPAVLAMSRPDSKKNLTTLVKAFGEHAMLRELANLVLIMVRAAFLPALARSLLRRAAQPCCGARRVPPAQSALLIHGPVPPIRPSAAGQPRQHRLHGVGQPEGAGAGAEAHRRLRPLRLGRLPQAPQAGRRLRHLPLRGRDAGRVCQHRAAGALWADRHRGRGAWRRRRCRTFLCASFGA